jgi:hypothetical protein
LVVRSKYLSALTRFAWDYAPEAPSGGRSEKYQIAVSTSNTDAPPRKNMKPGGRPPLPPAAAWAWSARVVVVALVTASLLASVTVSVSVRAAVSVSVSV